MGFVKEALIKRYFKKADVQLSVCSHRWFDIDTMCSAMQLFANKKHSYYWAPVRGDALISRARGRTASHFLFNSKCDVLFFLDDDIVFSEDDATKLIDDCVSGCDIVGGMYVQKKTGNKTCVLFDGQEVKFAKDQKPVEVEAVATGFMAINRRVLEEMARAKNPDGTPFVPLCHPGTLNYHPFFNPFWAQKKGTWVDLSEDWAFCARARQLGFKIWLDPSLYLGHKGEYVYDLADKIREPKRDLDTISLVLK